MNDDDKIKVVTKTGFPNGHALIIGISSYPKVTPLPTAVINDAREIITTLKSPSHCGYNPENITLLLDNQATLQAIRRELEALVERTQWGDTVFIFFSGHGACIGEPDNLLSVLIPFDCDPIDISGTTLPENEFSNVLASIKAQRLIVVIDACHSGGAGNFQALSKDFSPIFGFSEKSLEQLAQGTGRVLIASSRSTETSLILSGAMNSLFTEHFVDALRGKANSQGDGLIRVFEIFNYVSEKVRNAVPGRQHPIFKASDLEDNFPVSLYRGGVKNITTASNVDNEAQAWRNLEDIFADLYPSGPLDQEIWARAGGDISRLRLAGTGRTNWFAALRTMRQGGGGKGLSQGSLIQTALQDFPHHQELKQMI